MVKDKRKGGPDIVGYANGRKIEIDVVPRKVEVLRVTPKQFEIMMRNTAKAKAAK